MTFALSAFAYTVYLSLLDQDDTVNYIDKFSKPQENAFPSSSTLRLMGAHP
jgi:hypothetical protein